MREPGRLRDRLTGRETNFGAGVGVARPDTDADGGGMRWELVEHRRVGPAPADGRARQVTVYALGFKGRVSGVTPEQSERRRGLERFIEPAGDAGALGDGVVHGSERRYEPTAVAVFVRPSDTREGDTHAWPLGDLAGSECFVLGGSDAAAVLEAARTAREGVAWQSAGAAYSVISRPLLPDEITCEDVD